VPGHYSLQLQMAQRNFTETCSRLKARSHNTQRSTATRSAAQRSVCVNGP